MAKYFGISHVNQVWKLWDINFIGLLCLYIYPIITPLELEIVREIKPTCLPLKDSSVESRVVTCISLHLFSGAKDNSL